MTASITGRKRCYCGQYKVPLANGTMPRHTKVNMSRPRLPWNVRRITCEYSGKFPPIEVAAREKANAALKAKGEALYITVQVQPHKDGKVRGGRRATKRNLALKARYRRNSAGGYNR